MLTPSQQEWMFKSSLDTIDRNFERRDPQSDSWNRIFTPPTLDEVVAGYSGNDEIRNRIDAMLQADAIQRLYAAILLSKVDESQSQSALKRLENDETAIAIQAHLGFRIVQTTVGVLARDFLSEQQTRGANFSQEEGLDDWATAIWQEKRELKRDPNPDSLPKWQAVLRAREDAARMDELRVQIERLKSSDIVAEKFYAAFLLRTLDETESRQIIENLLNEETPVMVGQGDLKMNLPAREVAADWLNPQTEFHTSPPSNWIARAQKWLERNYFRRFDK